MKKCYDQISVIQTTTSFDYKMNEVRDSVLNSSFFWIKITLNTSFPASHEIFTSLVSLQHLRSDIGYFPCL